MSPGKDKTRVCGYINMYIYICNSIDTRIVRKKLRVSEHI